MQAIILEECRSCGEHETEDIMSTMGPGVSASGGESHTLGEFKGFSGKRLIRYDIYLMTIEHPSKMSFLCSKKGNKIGKAILDQMVGRES